MLERNFFENAVIYSNIFKWHHNVQTDAETSAQLLYFDTGLEGTACASQRGVYELQAKK
jgi:hypothetical protein